MKRSVYTKQTGICCCTAWRWSKAGKLPGFQVDTGTLIVTNTTPEKAKGVTRTRTAIYTRVCAVENKSNFEGQAQCLQADCTVKGYQVAVVVKEIDSD